MRGSHVWMDHVCVQITLADHMCVPGLGAVRRHVGNSCDDGGGDDLGERVAVVMVVVVVVVVVCWPYQWWLTRDVDAGGEGAGTVWLW